MTGDEWQSCGDVSAMFRFVEARADERKLRLFGVACCRRAWHLMDDEQLRYVIEAAERFADGHISRVEFDGLFAPVVQLWGDRLAVRKGDWTSLLLTTSAVRHLEPGDEAEYAARFIADALALEHGPEPSPEWQAARWGERAAQCHILRDVIGDPSRPFAFDPHWLAGLGRAAVARAAEIDRHGRFDQVPALADDLESAGGRARAAVEHCRGTGPHVRGCWVVDALLGRVPAVHFGLTSHAYWMTCDDVEPLFHFLHDKGDDRQRRQFAVACCRRILHLMPDERSRRAVDVASFAVDGVATAEMIDSARAAAVEVREDAHFESWRAEAEANFCVTPKYAAAMCRHHAASAACAALDLHDPCFDREPPWRAASDFAVAAVNSNVLAEFGDTERPDWWAAADRAATVAGDAELAAQCDLLRDIFAENFGPPGDNAAWLPFRHRQVGTSLSPCERWCLLPTPRGDTSESCR